MEIFLIKALQFLLAISLLVLLHEGGHFFFAKLFGVRVEKFYLFFDPSIWKWNGSIFKWKPKKSDTTYGVGWLPLGGYCKIAGMIDESMDTEQMKQPEQPWEFRAKPAWQRLLIMIGGVLVNFLLALFIYSMVLFTWGDSYIPLKNMSMGMKFNQEAKEMGFQDHDILVGTDLGTFKTFNGDMYRDLCDAHRCDIIRDGKAMSIDLPGDMNLLDLVKKQPPFVSPFVPAIIDSVPQEPKTPAVAIGLQKDDQILAINGDSIDSWTAFNSAISRLNDQLTDAKTPADSLRMRTISMVYQKKGSAKADTVTTTLTSDLKLGIIQRSLTAYYEPVTDEYGFFESFPAGIKYGWDILSGYVNDLQYLFSAEGAKSLGGFGTIGSLFPATWDWHLFWLMTAFLSIILAFMNILPIPALDGGHVLFLLYEMIFRRKPSEKFMIWAEYIGIGILLLLMVVANLNDILRWLHII